MSDINDTLNQIQSAFTELKATNEQKLGEMATKGSVDTLIDSKMDAINATITELTTSVTEMEKKAARPAINGNANLTENEMEHKSAFNEWARHGDNERELKAIEKKAITIGGTDAPGLAAGGYLMPKQVESGINRTLETLSAIRAEATVISTTSGDYRFLTGAGDFESGWVGETDPRPETATGTLGEVRVPAGEIYANPHASQWALDDTAFDLEAYMVDQTALAFAKRENTAFISGDGVNKPSGILINTNIKTVKSGVAYNGTSGAGMPTSGDAYLQMIYALPAAYRAGAKFVMASASQLSVRTLKDGNGNYIWQPSLVAGAPQTVGGFGIVEVEEMDAVGANKLPVVFGNIKLGYLIVDRIGIRTLRDPYSKKPFVGFYSTKRVGGLVKDASAFVALKIGA